jgi:lipoyl(octanoyl) transferase
MAESGTTEQREGEEPARTDWTLWVEDAPRPGWANMAIDQALLERAHTSDEGWLRLYTWEPHCLSFGRHEPAARCYDRERMTAMGLDAVRRPTGGRAVWHSRELTYAVAIPYRLFGSLQSAYLEIHRMLAEALRLAGLPVSLAPRARVPGLEAGACFAEPVGGEIMKQGRKLVGSAQVRWKRALLQHGSILLADDQQMVAACARLGGEGAPCSDQQHQAPELPLSSDQLIEAITGASLSRWRGTWRRISGSAEVLEAARLHVDRFRSAAWTWER